MSRPSKTFLIEAGALRFRVDLRKTAGGYEQAGVFRDGIEDGRSLPGSEAFDAFDPMGGVVDHSWITSLLKQRPKPAPEVTILSDRLTSVVAEIPGGPGEDWRMGAEMEAQTISGLSSSEAVAASTRLPAESGMMCVWVTQVAMRDVAAMRTAVGEASKSRLVSVGHPAGIRLDSSAPQLESWTEFSLFHVAGGERIELRGWNGPEALAEAREDGEVAAALVKAGDSGFLLLAASDDMSAEKELSTVVDFSTSSGMETWSVALARACDPLTGQVLGLPLVNVPKQPPSPKALALAATGIAVGAALLLGGHYLLNRLNKANLEADLVRLQEPANRVAESRNKISELNREFQTLSAKQDDSASSDVNVYAHRRRIGALLDGIAVGSGVQGVVVLEFRPDKLDTVLTGAATTFNAPQALAGRIDAALAENGWRASLVRRTAKLLRSDGGPWSYEIRLTPGRPVSVDGPFIDDDDSSAANTSPSSRGGEESATAISF